MMILIEQSDIAMLSSWLAFVGIVYGILELMLLRLKDKKKNAA
jgi:hypothetical protein